MNLTEQIGEDLKNAMKAGDKLRVGALRMVRAALLELQKSGSEVTPEMEQKALQNQAKRRRDAAEQFRNANRPDLADNEEAELQIIAAYLPKQVGDDEIRVAVEAIIAETGASGPGDFKVVMPKAMAALRGRADGAKVQAVVREELERKGV